MPPSAPQKGEVARIVTVLHRMPKQTVTHYTKVWHPMLLRTQFSLGLRALRRGAR